MLKSWENKFSDAILKINPQQKGKTGSLLAVVPNYSQWFEFTSSVKSEWHEWCGSLEQYPNSLLVLYGGIAFFEYDDNRFWPQFAEAVGVDSIANNHQTAINSSFEQTAYQLGFPVQIKNERTLFVSTAVCHIGIPISLWDGFLDICKWASWREDWKDCSESEWNEAVTKRSGSKLRLRKVLIDNRESATDFIKEILDVREILQKDPNLPLSEIRQATILRPEYFDEVPETAEFLRPLNPESLFEDRPRLVWNEQKRRISLYLPGIDNEKLPAIWSLEHLSQGASTTPSELNINSVAFEQSLRLKLNSKEESQTQRIRGLYPFGIADLSSGRFLNSDRDELPLKSYVLISSEKIEFESEGFENEDNTPNEEFELSDQKTCYITRLWPTDKRAELNIKLHNSTRKIRFRTRERIEAQFIAGQNHKAAYFRYINENKVKLEETPVLCITIPRGYFKDNYAELRNRFQVLRNHKPSEGQWEKHEIQNSEEREFFLWRWDKEPFRELKSGVVSSFASLKNLRKPPPDTTGDNVFTISSGKEFHVEYNTYIDRKKRGMDDCWTNLPGAFLPWFLLCQNKDGMQWDDLMFAKDVIDPNNRISYYVLRKYAEYGLLSQRGHKWFIRESRATLRKKNENEFELAYCGDPSILWSLYRKMSNDTLLPVINVIDKRGQLAYPSMIWDPDFQNIIKQYLGKQNVLIAESLWNP